jgi:hypothetical protein
MFLLTTITKLYHFEIVILEKNIINNKNGFYISI